MNSSQHIPENKYGPVIARLNLPPEVEIDKSKFPGRWKYEHPVLDDQVCMLIYHSPQDSKGSLDAWRKIKWNFTSQVHHVLLSDFDKTFKQEASFLRCVDQITHSSLFVPCALTVAPFLLFSPDRRLNLDHSITPWGCLVESDGQRKETKALHYWTWHHVTSWSINVCCK
jgi:hypothetical protein